MNTILYMAVAFVVLFVMVKKKEPDVFKVGPHGFFADTIFLDIVATTLFWPIMLPAKLAWHVMDRIWKKFNPNDQP